MLTGLPLPPGRRPPLVGPLMCPLVRLGRSDIEAAAALVFKGKVSRLEAAASARGVGTEGLPRAVCFSNASSSCCKPQRCEGSNPTWCFPSLLKNLWLNQAGVVGSSPISGGHLPIMASPSRHDSHREARVAQWT